MCLGGCRSWCVSAQPAVRCESRYMVCAFVRSRSLAHGAVTDASVCPVPCPAAPHTHPFVDSMALDEPSYGLPRDRHRLFLVRPSRRQGRLNQADVRSRGCRNDSRPDPRGTSDSLSPRGNDAPKDALPIHPPLLLLRLPPKPDPPPRPSSINP